MFTPIASPASPVGCWQATIEYNYPVLSLLGLERIGGVWLQETLHGGWLETAATCNNLA